MQILAGRRFNLDALIGVDVVRPTGTFVVGPVPCLRCDRLACTGSNFCEDHSPDARKVHP
jgi:hypothetical protein